MCTYIPSQLLGAPDEVHPESGPVFGFVVGLERPVRFRCGSHEIRAESAGVDARKVLVLPEQTKFANLLLDIC